MQSEEIEYSEYDTGLLKRRIRNESDRKIFQDVFDSKTLDTVHKLAEKGLFDVLDHIVATGKEAHVFIASNAGNTKRAVKVFKRETSDFRKMSEYIEGDRRFEGYRKDRRNLVLAWVRKEFKNLSIAMEAGLSVPMPLGFEENVLVMEFIGNGDKPAPRLKDTRPSGKQLSSYKGQIIDFAARLYLAGLVHADLSEYNILVQKKLVVIDFAQGVLLSHPKAKEFFERDLRNMANYFTRAGLPTEFDDLYAAVKERKEELNNR
ncbi:MAG: serine protein kinase RIO [Candidatus Diapherotrites archaeon]|uniref:non-specific serine/threonine protein kinase n=1 Tax=Candidatus Iainarchaeum sp. TaxID=3101447 RepID=A0A8T3YL24_9ARCH|nr:serine protein kinase RIO [Candidatus Diapherotrites archaeon]